MGCAHHRSHVESYEPSWSYAVEFGATYDLSSEEEAAGVWSPMRSFHESVTANVGVRFTRNFRDDSHGWWIEIYQMEVLTSRNERSVLTAPHPLEGLGVELRRFGDGEILKIDQAEYWFGGERGGESYDFIFPLISPHPPDMGRGEEAYRRTRWPFSASGVLGWANHQDAQWQNKGTEQFEGQKVWRLHYTGTWRIEGGSNAPLPSAQVSGTGPISGEVLIRVADYRVVHHTFDWTRVVTLVMDSDGFNPIAQKQRFVGSLRLIQ